MFVGRFNPPTVSHMEIIQKMADENSAIGRMCLCVIVDGKETGKNVSKNPLSGNYRKEILKQHVPNNVRVIVVKNPATLFSKLKAKNINISTIYSGDDRNYHRLCEWAGHNTNLIQIKRNSISATQLRNAIKENNIQAVRSMAPEWLDIDFVRRMLT